MLRARLSNGTFVMGVDDENIRRLTSGQPIVIDLVPLGGQDKIMVVHGHTLADIERELVEASGKPLPPAQPWPYEGPTGPNEPQQ